MLNHTEMNDTRWYRLRQGWRDWLRHHDFCLAVTVNANRPLALDRQEHVLRQIDGKLNRAFCGPRFARLPDGERVGIVGVPETKVSGVHFHCAVAIRQPLSDDDKVRIARGSLSSLTQIRSVRGALLPGASIHVTPCDAGWGEYIVKSIVFETIVYARGLSGGSRPRTVAGLINELGSDQSSIV